MHTPLSHWIWFHVALVVLLAIEYGGVHLIRGTHRKAIFATTLWVAAALALAAIFYPAYGARPATEYLAGYALEQSLSIDNLFVFLLLFRLFRIPADRQARVLFWGVGGAMLMRGAFIAAGIGLLNRFHWINYVFAAILLYAGARLLRPEAEHEYDGPPKWLQWLTKLHPVSANLDHFFVREAPAPGAPVQRMITVLFVALIAVELTDIVFALDSIPAVLSITRHPFLAYTSNVMAVMNLRSLYILLAAMLSRLRFLHYGLALVLLFAAIKMLISTWVDIGPLLSLGIIAALLGGTIAASLLRQQETGSSE